MGLKSGSTVLKQILKKNEILSMIKPTQEREKLAEDFAQIWLGKIQPFKSLTHTFAEHDLSSWRAQYSLIDDEIDFMLGLKAKTNLALEGAQELSSQGFVHYFRSHFCLYFEFTQNLLISSVKSASKCLPDFKNLFFIIQSRVCSFEKVL